MYRLPYFRRPCRRALVASVLALGWAAPAAWAQAGATATTTATEERIETRAYDFEAAGIPEMHYELFVPSGYDASTPTPLIVLLHGLGSSAERVIRYDSMTEYAEERGYIVVAPEGYNERGWYGSRGPGPTGGQRADGSEDPENLGELSELDVMNVADLTMEQFNVDPDRVYLMGHSMGGGGTLYLGMKYADRWAGLGAIAPAIYSSPDELEPVSHLSVMILQGDEDALVSVDRTREWIAKMEELDMTHNYIEVPGGDHSRIITQNPDNMRAFFDFFDQQRRGQ